VTRYPLPHGEIIRARVEDVYPTIPDGTVTLLHSDGPYGMSKAAWDKVRDLAAFYRPHIAEWSRLCAPSASVYLWNTAEGWATIHPEMVAAGWTFRALVTWDKGIGFLAGKCDNEGTRTWPDVTEVCGFYQRNAWDIDTCAGSMIGEAAGKDKRNPTTAFIREEREASGLTRKGMAAHFPSRTGGLTGCVTNWEEGYNFPTWDVFQRFASACAEAGPPRERPYLVHPSVWPGGGLRTSYDHLRAEYDHLRAEYEAARCFFDLPMGIANVWGAPQVQGSERLTGADGATLHPCQKPLAFAERVILASSRPGDVVFEPFGGTCRIAVANERLARFNSADARRTITVEMDEDGRDYIGAVLRSMGADLGTPGTVKKQAGLFG
jgi:hypothetical protein